MSQITLDQIRVATPCPVSWDEMQGDAAVRYCSQCSLKVYNLAEMNRDEADTLINRTEGRVCIRLFRRRDGTIITRDCPVGRRTLHRQVLALVGAVAGAILLVGTGALASAGIIAQRQWGDPATWSIFNWWNSQPGYPGGYGPVAGEMCIEPPPTVPIPIEDPLEESDVAGTASE